MSAWGSLRLLAVHRACDTVGKCVVGECARLWCGEWKGGCVGGRWWMTYIARCVVTSLTVRLICRERVSIPSSVCNAILCN